jgi:hypothetical protein
MHAHDTVHIRYGYSTVHANTCSCTSMTLLHVQNVYNAVFKWI